MRGLLRVISSLGATLPLTALACTVCDSDTGQQVRAGIAQDFWPTLLALAAPFSLLLLGVFAFNWTRR